MIAGLHSITRVSAVCLQLLRWVRPAQPYFDFSAAPALHLCRSNAEEVLLVSSSGWGQVCGDGLTPRYATRTGIRLGWLQPGSPDGQTLPKCMCRHPCDAVPPPLRCPDAALRSTWVVP